MIEDALARAECVLVLWSLHSVESEWVRAEAEDGLKRGILLPAIIDLNVTLPLRFRQIQGVDLSRWNGVATAEELNDLVRDIDALLTRNSVAQSSDTANITQVNAPSVVSALRAAGEDDQQIVEHIRYVAEQGKLLAQAWSDVARELVQASVENIPDFQKKLCKKYRLHPTSNLPYFYAVSAFYDLLVQHGAFDKGMSDWSAQVESTLEAILTAREVQHGPFDEDMSDYWSAQVESTLEAILAAREQAKMIHTYLILGYLEQLPSMPGYQPVQQFLDHRIILIDEPVLCEYLLCKLSSLVDVLWKEASELDVLARTVTMEIRRNQR